MTAIRTAMLLAAGFGKRMRHLTADRPKPMVELAGKPLIGWAMDRLEAAGVERFVVNTHYLGDRIEAHFAAHFAGDPRITLIHEPDILETGGGVKNALPLLGDAPFFVVNSDAVWLDGAYPALKRLNEAWDPERMDILLLMMPSVGILDYAGPGDYHLEQDGLARRRKEGEVSPYVFAGVQIISPRAMKDTPEGAFSLNIVYDRAEQEGRLFGIVHDGEWYHVGTPEALAETEEIIALGHTKANTR